jgi:four helix bundle protein
MKDFKKLIISQKSMDLFVDAHRITKKLPLEERFEIGAQVRRSAFSIPANISQGSAKATNAHYKLFPENSLGSAYETETALIAILRLYSGVTQEIEGLLERTEEIQRMLIAFINKLK